MICIGIGGVIFLEMEHVYDLALLGKGSWSFRVVEIGPMPEKDTTWQESLTGVVSRLKLVPPCQPEERGWVKIFMRLSVNAIRTQEFGNKLEVG